MSRFAQRVAYVVIGTYAALFVSFMLTFQFFGGSARQGKIEQGSYFLRYRYGVYTTASERVYSYLWWHETLMWIGLVGFLLVAGCGAFVRMWRRLAGATNR